MHSIPKAKIIPCLHLGCPHEQDKTSQKNFLSYIDHSKVHIESNIVFTTPSSVGKWAMQFGDELWELAQRMTKSQEIKAVSTRWQATSVHFILAYY